MAESDNIERTIKEGFESVQHKAPENLWSDISESLFNNSTALDKKVKSSFLGNNANAPEGIWFNIDKQLTIDRGWMKVHNLLQRRTFYKWTKRIAAFLIFLFLFAPEVKNGFSDLESAKFSQKNNDRLPKDIQKIASREQDKLAEKALFENLFNESQTKDSDKMLNKQQTNLATIVSEKEVLSSVSNAEKLTLKSSYIEKDLPMKTESTPLNHGHKDDFIDFQNIHPLPLKSLISLPLTINQTELVDIENRTPRETKFEFGLYTALNSTSIINNATRRAFDAKSLVAYNPSLKSNLGFQFIYHFNANHSLASTAMHAGVRQSYNKYSNGSLNEEVLNLNFIRLQTLYQFKYKRFNTQKSMFNIKVGPYFGFRTKSDFKINNQVQTEALDYFNSYDLGLTLQVGHSVEWSKLILDYGLTMDKGLTNLYRGTDFVPASFDRTTLLGIGTYVSLRYKL
jgi:hypothetical protein